MDIIVTRAGITGIDPAYIVGGIQHGNGWTIHDTPFQTEKDAITEAESRWFSSHSSPEFASPSEDKRFKWEVTKYSDWDAESEKYRNIETVWSKEADDQ